MPDPFPNERPTFCVTMDCGLRATRYVTCDGEGRHPYCEECADVLIRGGESDLGQVTQPRVPDPFPSELVEAAAKALAGEPRCYCPDDWRADPSPRCPFHGDGEWPTYAHYLQARAVLTAVLPLIEQRVIDRLAREADGRVQRLQDAIHAADRELITIADFSIQEAADAIDSVRAGLKDALAETDVPAPDDANVRPAQPYGWEGAEVVLVPGPKLGPPITVLTCSALCGWICATDDDGPFLCGACDRNGTMVPIGEVPAELEDLLRELTEAAALVPVQQSNRTETGQARVERFTEALVQARAFLRRARGEGAKP